MAPFRRIGASALLLALAGACHHDGASEAAASGDEVVTPGVVPAVVDWEDVRVVDKAPAGCRLVGEVDHENWRLWPFTSNKSQHQKVVKKLKKKAANLGANVLVITGKDTTAINESAEAQALRCP